VFQLSVKACHVEVFRLRQGRLKTISIVLQLRPHNAPKFQPQQRTYTLLTDALEGKRGGELR